jgi:hypothetical protein
VALVTVSSVDFLGGGLGAAMADWWLFRLSSARRLAAATASDLDFGVCLEKSGVSSGGGGAFSASSSGFVAFVSGVREDNTNLASSKAALRASALLSASVISMGELLIDECNSPLLLAAKK